MLNASNAFAIFDMLSFIINKILLFSFCILLLSVCKDTKVSPTDKDGVIDGAGVDNGVEDGAGMEEGAEVGAEAGAGAEDGAGVVVVVLVAGKTRVVVQVVGVVGEAGVNMVGVVIVIC